MKKLIIALLLGLIVPSLVFADSSYTTTKAGRGVNGQQGISNVAAIADGSTGYTARVDSKGALETKEKPCSVATVAGQDAVALTGAYRVYSITAAGTAVAAGDKIDIYDALSATGTPKLEISVGTAKNTNQVVIPQGMQFTTGVFVDQSANNMLVSICYDN